MTDIEKYNESVFEGIRHVNEYGQEYWLARELQKALEYTEWRKFEHAITRAIEACETSGNEPSDHFVGAARGTKPPASSQGTRMPQ